MFNLEPQKCLHLWKEEEKKKPNLTGEYISSIKLNGWYVYLDYSTTKGWSNFHSSAMREIPAFKHYKNRIDSLPPLSHCTRLIAEAIIPGMDFFEMNGIFNKSVGNFNAENVEFYFHDMFEPFTAERICPALERYRNLQNYFDKNSRVFFNSIENFKVHEIEGIYPYHKELWYDKFNFVVGNEEEGLVFKRVDSIYTPGKRNADLVKMKMESTYDLLCVDMYWTKGEKGNDNLNLDLKNKLGALTPVRIGKHSDIAEFSINSPVGKVVEIKCMCITKYGNYKEPRFNRIRNDKLSKDID